MNDKTVTTIRDHFSTLTDPRVIGRTDHKLIDILTIALCAAISGADSYADIETYGHSKFGIFSITSARGMISLKKIIETRWRSNSQ